MKRIATLLTVLLAVCLTNVGAERPNVIHIMADDLGWRDLSVYGSETFETPHLDRLAAQGMLFTDAYSASPLCSPTRAATLTGQTVGRLRITAPHGHILEPLLDPTEAASGPPGLPMTAPGVRNRIPMGTFTIGNLFQAAGYKTAFMGKWHLGHDPYIPENFGFERVVGGRGTPGPPQSRFFGPWDPEESNMPTVEGSPNVDDVLVDQTVEFITEHKTQPFFIALWLYNVHAPFEGRPEVIESFRENAASARYQRYPVMGSMVKTMDDNVGRLMEALDTLGLADNTIIIFTSDNGGNMYDRPDGVFPTDNSPLRAGKGNAYEGGVRVPLIVRWPGVVPAGTVSNAVNISYDWLPTFAEMLGAKVPEEHPVDGTILLPALRGEPFERGPIFSIFPHNVPTTGNVANAWVREGRWKLLRFFHTGPDFADELELYDLSTDIGETTNLAPTHPEMAGHLNSTLQQHLESTAALLPGVNPNYQPNFHAMGVELLHGGVRLDGPNSRQVSIVGRGPRVILRYFPADAESGSFLRLVVDANTADSVTAGVGETPVFGRPMPLVPDSKQHTVEVPLGRAAREGDAVTVSFDLPHPGKIFLHGIELDE